MIFFTVAYAIAWLGVPPIVLSATVGGPLPIHPPFELIILPTFAPTIAALVAGRQ